MNRRMIIALSILTMTAVFCASGVPAFAHAPRIERFVGADEAMPGEEHRGQFIGADDDGDPVVFTSITPGAAVQADGRTRWTPTEADANLGHKLIRVRFTDGNSTWIGGWRVSVFKFIESDHFKIYWSNFSTNRTKAEFVRDALETGTPNAWDIEIGRDNLGYAEPRCLAPDNKMPIYVKPIPYCGLTSRARPVPDCETCKIWINPYYNDGIIQASCAHEFFHAVQDAYSWRDRWWLEATAVWMEERVFDDVNDYISYFRTENSTLNRPGWFAENTYSYSGNIYPIFLDEKTERPDWIKRSFVRLQTTRSGNAFDLIEKEGMLGTTRFRKLWQEFALRNIVITGFPGHEYSEGNTFNRTAKIWKEFTAISNLHAVTEAGIPAPGAAIRRTVAAQYPPQNTKGMKIDHADFRKLHGRLPGLSAAYVKVDVPMQLGQNRSGPVKAFLRFKGDSGTPWGCRVVRQKRNGEWVRDVTTLLDSDSGRNQGTADFDVGGDRPGDTGVFCIIVSNAALSETPKRFEISGVITPGFQQAYKDLVPGTAGRNRDTGTSRTVKNMAPEHDGNNLGPDEDAVYKNGDTVQLRVDLTDRIHLGTPGANPIPADRRSLTADFSLFDSGYTQDRVRITRIDPNRHVYEIEYDLTEDNTLHHLERYEHPLKIQATSLSEQHADKDRDVDETFILALDNEPPAVERVTLTQHQAGNMVTILDTADNAVNPAIIPVIGESILHATVYFSEAMLQHEADGSFLEADLSLVGKNGPMEFDIGKGWAWRDTWNAEISFTKNDILPEPNCTLVVSGKDKAGNTLDLEPNEPGDQPDDTISFMWKVPAVTLVKVEQDGRIVYDSAQPAWREGAPGQYDFTVDFDEPMDTMSLSFGPGLPYEKARIDMRPNTERMSWTGSFTVSKEDFPKWQGAHRIKIQGSAPTGMPLDTDPHENDAQPRLADIFLIGTPKAWLADVDYIERRNEYFERNDPKDKSLDNAKYRVQLNTGFTVRLKEDWSECIGVRTMKRSDMLAERAGYVNATLRLILELQRTLGNRTEADAYFERMVRFPEPHQKAEFARQRAERYEQQKAALSFDRDMLDVLEGVRFYTPTRVDVQVNGHIDRFSSVDNPSFAYGETTDINLFNAHGEVREHPEGVPPHFRLGEYARPMFKLILTTVPERTWKDYLRKLKDRVYMYGYSGRVMDLGCWDEYINFPAERQDWYTATFDAHLPSLFALARKNGEWIGFSEIGEESREVRFPIGNGDKELTEFGYRKSWPFFEYMPLSGDRPPFRTTTTGDIVRFGAYDTVTSHYYRLNPVPGTVSFRGSFAIRGLLRESTMSGRVNLKEKFDGVIDITILVSPLPEGEL